MKNNLPITFLLLFSVFTFSIPFNLSAQPNCSHLDYPALEALYNATDGANWTDNTNWDSNCDPCSWYGVSCEGGRVSHINLINNNLVGTLPSELGDLDMLQFLFLTTNGLTGGIPSELGNLSKLKSLYLTNNELTGTIPSELGNLDMLINLFLNTNQLTGCIPTSFSIFCDNTVNISFNPNLDEEDFSTFCSSGSGVCSSICDFVINLTGTHYSYGDYNASYKITSIATVASPFNITYEAGQFILLNDGFEVKSGAAFLATINDCSMAGTLQENDANVAERAKGTNNKIPTSQIVDLEVFPNPFSEQSTIQFYLPQKSEAQLNMYNINGVLVKNILPFATYGEGQHQMTLVVGESPSGIYYLVLKMEDGVQTQKVMLQR